MADEQPASAPGGPAADHNPQEPGVRQAAAAAASAAVSKRKNRGNLRKRAAADSDDDNAGDAGGVARPAQRAREAPLAFTTRREDRAEGFKFESSGTVTVHNDSGATRALETETAHDRDNRAVRERALAATADAGDAPGDAVYRGMTGYKDYRAGFRRENNISGLKSAGTHGPLRASTNVRMSIRVDYQPDVCKDYKETGYCGYGDACKFLHDRGDYKQGWQIDADWEKKQKERKERLAAGLPVDEEEEEGEEGVDGEKKKKKEEEEVPFACLICRRAWAECQDPVVTRCKHYFCEQCALQHNAKSKRCAVCEEPTGGIFNVANDVIRRERDRRRREEAEEA
jgi:RING finger protein 113A